MSKRALVFCVVLCLTTAAPCVAQVTTTLGVKGGTNISTATQKDANSFDNKIGYVAGPFLRVTQNDLGIQIEALLGTQGGKQGGGHNFNLDLTYLQVPVLAYIGLPVGERVRPFVVGGGVFGGRLKVDLGAVSATPEKDFKRSDVSIALGAGATISNLVSVEARFTQGMRDNASGFGHQKFGTGEIKNRMISIMVGLAIRP